MNNSNPYNEITMLHYSNTLVFFSRGQSVSDAGEGNGKPVNIFSIDCLLYTGSSKRKVAKLRESSAWLRLGGA